MDDATIKIVKQIIPARSEEGGRRKGGLEGRVKEKTDTNRSRQDKSPQFREEGALKHI